MEIVIAIDFDDTIVSSAFPEIKGAKRGAIRHINKLYDKGYYIIIWTCRHGQHQEMAIQWLADNGVKYHQINQQHPKLIEYYQNDTRKISADIYIDDKSLTFLIHPGWRTIYWLIKLKRLFMKSKILDV